METPNIDLPIIGVHSRDLPEAMVVVGDPIRAEKAAEMLDDVHLLARNREYVSYVGSYEGASVGVISHGVGSPGAAICFEELFRGGVKRVVRAGTAGGMQPEVQDGDLVIATGAVRTDGYTQGIVPEGFPAVADRGLTTALVDAAAETHEGIVLTSAVFYPQQVIGSDLELWQRSGVMAVEMEAAALFVLASLHGVAAGAIFAIDGNPLDDDDSDMSGYDPDRDVVHQAVDRALHAAFAAVTV
ncbi:MAG: purine-nucleoside phosphorylase [Acidimicrobiia bacterium]|nr:purine-nucleoside phosphorylase [Acidimicrobiia bacterium]